MDARVNERPYRYFLTYSGVKLPLNLVRPLEPDELENRNTYFRATFDESDRMLTCEKIVYGEIEFIHTYAYRENGVLSHARIELGGEATEVVFDTQGAPTRP